MSIRPFPILFDVDGSVSEAFFMLGACSAEPNVAEETEIPTAEHV